VSPVIVPVIYDAQSVDDDICRRLFQNQNRVEGLRIAFDFNDVLCTEKPGHGCKLFGSHLFFLFRKNADAMEPRCGCLAFGAAVFAEC